MVINLGIFKCFACSCGILLALHVLYILRRRQMRRRWEKHQKTMYQCSILAQFWYIYRMNINVRISQFSKLCFIRINVIADLSLYSIYVFVYGVRSTWMGSLHLKWFWAFTQFRNVLKCFFIVMFEFWMPSSPEESLLPKYEKYLALSKGFFSIKLYNNERKNSNVFVSFISTNFFICICKWKQIIHHFFHGFFLLFPNEKSIKYSHFYSSDFVLPKKKK